MRGQKFPKMAKYVATTALFQLHDEDSWLFSSPCNTTGLVLKICERAIKLRRVATKGGREREREREKVQTWQMVGVMATSTSTIIHPY